MSEITGHYPTEAPPIGMYVWPYRCYHRDDIWSIVTADDSMVAVVEDSFLSLGDDDLAPSGKTHAQEMAEHIVDLLNKDAIEYMAQYRQAVEAVAE